MFEKAIKGTFAAAALILALSVLVFAFKYHGKQAQAVAVSNAPLSTKGAVFTQSKDGKTLYVWEWDRRLRQWKSYANHRVGRP